MNEGTNLAKAYVQIVPSAQGIKSALGEMLGNEIGEPSKKAGSKAGSNIVGMIKKAVAAAGIGVAIKKVVSEALSEGADLQQSIGGIETLFGAGGANSVQEYARSVGKSVTEVQETYDSLKASEEKMLAFADNAWKTAGLSANDYMETSTSFAASLLSSLDGDTNAAAEAANKAVIAMADNANKMGTDMQSIQNAYQGFAKQNYTMLDNLKLGYGGTKTEMERLLADAEKLSGVHYDIDNLADVYNAVSVIQDKLGITGTTAKEAASTFSGSMASMKAAAQNVLGKLALGEDIMPALEALGESIKTFLLNNLLPMLGNIFNGAPQIAQAAGTIILELLNGIIANSESLIDGAIFLLDSVISGLNENGDQIGTAAVMLVEKLSLGLLQMAPEILSIGITLVLALINGLSDPDMIAQILKAAVVCTEQLIMGLIEAAPKLGQAGLNLVKGLWQGITGSMSWFKENIKRWVGNVVDFIKGLFKIGSPSKLMADEIGKFLPSGIAVGVDTNAYLVDDAFRDMADEIDAEATFTPAISRVLRTDGFGFTDMPGADAEPMRENGRSEELLEQILEILAQMLALYRGKPEDADGVLETLIAYLDQRFGRISAMKARGV